MKQDEELPCFQMSNEEKLVTLVSAVEVLLIVLPVCSLGICYSSKPNRHKEVDGEAHDPRSISWIHILERVLHHQIIKPRPLETESNEDTRRTSRVLYKP